MRMTTEEAREIRESLGLTKSQMAEQLGVQPSTVTRYETGVHIIRPSVANHYRLLRDNGIDREIADTEDRLARLKRMKEKA